MTVIKVARQVRIVDLRKDMRHVLKRLTSLCFLGQLEHYTVTIYLRKYTGKSSQNLIIRYFLRERQKPWPDCFEIRITNRYLANAIYQSIHFRGPWPFPLQRSRIGFTISGDGERVSLPLAFVLLTPPYLLSI